MRTQHSSNSRKPVIGLLPLLLVIVSAISMYLGVVAAAPYRAADEMKISDDQMQTRIEQLKIQNQQDTLDVRSASKPAGLQLAARRLGYVSKGESYLEIGRP
jgi:hypothetical protein